MPPDILVVRDRAELDRAVAAKIGHAVLEAVRERGWCFLALPGGSFVRGIYAELTLLQLPWSEVELFFTDERCVPPDHPASNYGEAEDALLKNPRIGAHQFHRIEAERPDRELACTRYAEELPDAFDLMLFELGADGHLGALFAGSPALAETERLVVAVEAPLKPRWRIVLTPPVLHAARRLLVVAHGREKAATAAKVLEGDAEAAQWPAALAREGEWVLDAGAASLLGSRA
jgi:6-phosphogluconolactonase